MNVLLRGLLGAAAAALGALIVSALLTTGDAATLNAAEWWYATWRMVAPAAALGLVASLVASDTRPARIGAAVLPLAVAIALIYVPFQGPLRVRVVQAALWGIGVVALLALVGLRTRFAPRIAAALGLFTAVGFVASMRSLHLFQPDAPPIVLLTIDTVRGDQFSFCGASDPVSVPNLEALARNSVRYCQAYAAVPLTGPSHTTMLSGMDPITLGIQANGQRIPKDIPWVPEILSDAGYATRAVVSAATLEPILGFRRGFDDYDLSASDRLSRGHRVFAFLGYEPHAGSAYDRPGAMTLGYVPTEFERGSFTWVHFFDAHFPYAPTPETAIRNGLSPGAKLDGAWGNNIFFLREADPSILQLGLALYRGELEDLDWLVGQVLSRLPNDAIVIVSGDHGESMGEHGETFDHGLVPYAPATHTPLLVYAPGWTPQQVDTPVSIADIGPTLLELAGLPIPEEMTARTLSSPLVDRAVLSYTFVSGHNVPTYGNQWLGPLAGIAARGGDDTVAATRWEDAARYTRSTDPLEQRGSALGRNDLLEQAATAAVSSAQSLGEAAVESEITDALRALGYIQ